MSAKVRAQPGDQYLIGNDTGRRHIGSSRRGSGPSHTFPSTLTLASESSAIAALSFLSQEEKLGFSDPFWQIHGKALCWEGGHC